MKAIIIGVACLTAGTGIAGCGAGSITTEMTTTAEVTTTVETTTAEITTTTTAATTSTTETAISKDAQAALYDDIINIYYVVQQKGGIVGYSIPEEVKQLIPKGGLWDYFDSSVCDTGSKYYYTINDFDNNGVDELVISNDNLAVAVYTISDEEVIPLAFGGYRNELKISDDGKAYLLSYGGHQDYQYYKYHLNENGDSFIADYEKAIATVKDGSAGYFYNDIKGKGFFETIDNDNSEITEKEFREAETEYNSVKFTLEKITVKASEKATAETANTKETAGNTDSNHSEDSIFMEYLRKKYDSNNDYYSKFAIADFDADGKNELALEHNLIGNCGLEIIDEEDLSLQYDDYTYINDHLFEFTKFLDNGVVYIENDKNYDSKEYYLIDRDWLSKLGYNPGEPGTLLERKIYYIEDYAIFKNFMSGNYTVNTKGYENSNEIITQEEYEKESQMLNGGDLLDFQVKNFTAENIGL